MRKKFGHIFKDNTLGHYDLGDANALINFGNILFQQEKYTEALDYFNEAMAIRATMEIKDETSLISTLTKMESIYDSLDEHGLASVYHERAAALTGQP